MCQVNIMFPKTYNFYKSSCNSCIPGSKCKKHLTEYSIKLYHFDFWLWVIYKKPGGSLLILMNQVPITQSCHSHQSQSTQSSKQETGESQHVSRKTKWNTTHRQNLVTHIQQILISCSCILGFLWYDTLFVWTQSNTH